MSHVGRVGVSQVGRVGVVVRSIAVVMGGVAMAIVLRVVAIGHGVQRAARPRSSVPSHRGRIPGIATSVGMLTEGFWRSGYYGRKIKE